MQLRDFPGTLALGEGSATEMMQGQLRIWL
jgi:hypothetical protein